MTDPIPASSPLPPVVAARYRLGEEIGRGGRAIVYAAEDTLLRRQVAVKVFRTDASQAEDLKLQEAEAQLVGGMNHYALTTLFDAGVDHSDPRRPRIYLVMERIPGVDLRQHLREHGPLTPVQLAYLGFDLAEGLQYVHEHGFLHRDIKPANVLLADRRISTRIRGKLTDFGIATLIGLPDTGEYTTGTAAYLSPEQANGQDPTTASDVYSLGLVLLEALTGHVEYRGGIEESAFARLDRDPVIPDTIPAPIADVLRGMTRLEPADRMCLAEIAEAFQQAYIDDLVQDGRVHRDLLPPDEEQRLAALRRYDILDTPSEDAFDEITAMAARVLKVPIALVSIVDVDRVWFKSRQNFDEPEVDRNVAFCSTTNPADGGAWSIPDALVDARTRDNRLVTGGPQVRSYAAASLRTSDGHDLGALCVFDKTPREFGEDDLANLTTLANVIMRELELRLASRRAIFRR